MRYQNKYNRYRKHTPLILKISLFHPPVIPPVLQDIGKCSDSNPDVGHPSLTLPGFSSRVAGDLLPQG